MRKKIIAALAIAVIFGIGAYVYYFNRSQKSARQPNPSQNISIATIPELKITFEYPARWGEASVSNSTRVQTGQAKYLQFKNIKADIPVFSFPSKDYMGGRSGTTAEVLTVTKQTDIKTCDNLAKILTSISASGGCQELKAKNGRPIFVFKHSKFESISAEGLYFTGLADFPVLGIESSESDFELIKEIVTSIDSI